MLKAQVPGVGGPISGTGSTEDIGDLKRGPHRLRAAGAFSLVLNTPSLSSGLVTVRTVRVATLV
jgi:hypothetical protein